jgi:type I restriction enzyme S subunit
MSIRATVGTVAVLPQSLDGANLTQGTARIAPGKRVRRNWLLWALRSPGIQQWIKRQIKGSTFLEITLGRLRELPVAVPPLPRQEQFAKIVEHGNRFYSQNVEALRQSDHLFQTLLHQAFGEA